MTKYSLANQTTAQKLIELQPHVAPDNQQSDPLSTNIDKPLAETTQNFGQQLTELTQNLLDMMNWAHWEERADLSRSLNSRALQDTDLLFALPLPNGGYPAEGEFPETLGEFMSLEGSALAVLLQLYKLPHQDQVTDARSTLARRFSILL